jgi:hypothetical protein
MTRLVEVSKRFIPLLVAVVVGLVYTLTVEGDTLGGLILALAVLALIGATAEIAWIGHPWRNGVLGGLISLLVVVPLALGIGYLLDTSDLAPGETWGSSWAELPFWMAVLSPIVFAFTVLGSAMAYFGLHWKPRGS